MLGLGRSNFGHHLIHFELNPFESKRQVKRRLRKVCGKKYPINFKIAIDKLSKGSALLLLISRKAADVYEEGVNRPYSSPTDIDSEWYLCGDNSANQQAWQYMKDYWKSDFTMKRPTK